MTPQTIPPSFRVIGIALTLLLILGCLPENSLQAQQPPIDPPPVDTPLPLADSDPFPVEPTDSDPTQPSPELRRAIQGDEPPPPPAAREIVAAIPDFRLRGRMVMNSRTVAILEMDGQSYVVGEGDELVVRGQTGGLITFQVVELNSRVARLNFPPREEVIYLP